MKILYLDVTMGAAGDMLTASLLELFEDRAAKVAELNDIGIPDVIYEAEAKASCGITGTHMNVSVHGVTEEHIHEHHDQHEHHEHDHEHHDHHHHHSSMHDIEHMIGHLNVSDTVKQDAIEVYKIIADAESKAHGVPVTDIHFHEVGTKDAVADIVAVCKLIRDIAPDRIIASRLCTGYGTVHCTHGILPVPAPATANIIEGLPAFGGSEEGERLTPTGAALIKHFASEYSSMPEMVITKTGYGVGTKEFKNGNFVRAFLGESASEDLTDKVIELAANIDDMTAEQISFAMDRLFTAGAVEVFTTPVTMKKSRPGTLITAICPVAQKESVVNCFFKHTSTIGIRERSYTRHILARSIETRATEFGDVRYKVSTGYGVTRSKPEYEDVAMIAREQEMSVEEVVRKL